MTFNFSGESANEVWKKAVNSISSTGGISNSRIGGTQEALHVTLTISDPRQKWISARVPAMNPAFALAELVWITNGKHESSVINHWNPSLPKYAGRDENYHGAYGYRLRHHFGFDQLEKAYLSLQNNPESRQVVMQIWDPKIDFPDDLGQPVSEDIPCNICSLLKVRNNKLEWTQILRSNDIFLGVPYNFVQFTGLQEILAGWLNVEVGTYTQLSDSLHIYQKDQKKMKIDSSKEEITNHDSLSLRKELSDKIIADIYNNMRKISNKNITIEEFEKYSFLLEDNQAYKNIMSIIAADSARRRGWNDLAAELMNRCKNELYKQMWYEWVKSKSKE